MRTFLTRVVLLGAAGVLLAGSRATAQINLRSDANSLRSSLRQSRMPTRNPARRTAEDEEDEEDKEGTKDDAREIESTLVEDERTYRELVMKYRPFLQPGAVQNDRGELGRAAHVIIQRVNACQASMASAKLYAKRISGGDTSDKTVEWLKRFVQKYKEQAEEVRAAIDDFNRVYDQVTQQ